MELKSGQFSIMDRMEDDLSVVKVEMFRPDLTNLRIQNEHFSFLFLARPRDEGGEGASMDPNMESFASLTSSSVMCPSCADARHWW